MWYLSGYYNLLGDLLKQVMGPTLRVSAPLGQVKAVVTGVEKFEASWSYV